MTGLVALAVSSAVAGLCLPIQPVEDIQIWPISTKGVQVQSVKQQTSVTLYRLKYREHGRGIYS